VSVCGGGLSTLPPKVEYERVGMCFVGWRAGVFRKSAAMTDTMMTSSKSSMTS